MILVKFGAQGNFAQEFWDFKDSLGCGYWNNFVQSVEVVLCELLGV